jgi:hypothetical protein
VNLKDSTMPLKINTQGSLFFSGGILPKREKKNLIENEVTLEDFNLK